MNTDTHDILVRVRNPEALDATLRMLPGARARVLGVGEEGGPVVVDGCFVVRASGDPGFVEWAMRNQGYAEVVRRLAAPVDTAGR